MVDFQDAIRIKTISRPCISTTLQALKSGTETVHPVAVRVVVRSLQTPTRGLPLISKLANAKVFDESVLLMIWPRVLFPICIKHRNLKSKRRLRVSLPPHPLPTTRHNRCRRLLLCITLILIHTPTLTLHRPTTKRRALRTFMGLPRAMTRPIIIMRGPHPHTTRCPCNVNNACYRLCGL